MLPVASSRHSDACVTSIRAFVKWQMKITGPLFVLRCLYWIMLLRRILFNCIKFGRIWDLSQVAWYVPYAALQSPYAKRDTLCS